MATGLSLHIGLNSVDPEHYQGWSGDLVACEADAKDMAQIASHKGFDATLLSTREATRKKVISEMEKAANALGSGDIFLLSYSGHGGQLPDLDGDEDDSLDETWCLFDGELVDDEVYLLLSNFQPGVRILSFSDSCHSGTVLKNLLTLQNDLSLRYFSGIGPGINLPPPITYRAMPAAIANSTYLANSELYNEILMNKELKSAKDNIKASTILISGCQDNQLSADGPFNGRFTGILKSVWNSGKFNGSHKKFHKVIGSRMPPDQTPNFFTLGIDLKGFEAQVPFTI